MEYRGKVYAKINGKYIECTETVNDLEQQIKELKNKWSASVSDVQFTRTSLTIIKEELRSTKYRAETFLSGPIDTKEEYFYRGQMTLIGRLEDTINDTITN
jgi:hypothetical protein